MIERVAPTLGFFESDGGRADAGFKRNGRTGDCVVRAIANATWLPYISIYNDLRDLQVERNDKIGHIVERTNNVPDKGISRDVYEPYLQRLGWTWVPVMRFGTGCLIHMRAGELPTGTLIVRLSRHLSVVRNHVVYDLYDPSRGGTRCVYGYFVELK